MTTPQPTDPTLHGAGLAAALRAWFGEPSTDIEDSPASAVWDMERTIGAYLETTRPTIEKDCAE